MVKHSETTLHSPDEIKFTRSKLSVLAQKRYFHEEHQALTQKTQIYILTLNLSMNPKGIIRVNGRLSNSATLSYNERWNYNLNPPELISLDFTT